MIEFYSYLPQVTKFEYQPFVSKSFEKIGYIRLDNNKKNNYKSREFRKIFVNTNCIYFKISVDKNYVNKFNIFNQVRIMSIEFLGKPYIAEINYLEEEKAKEQEDEKDIEEELIDDICKEKIKILETLKEEVLKKDDLEEANIIQGKIESIRSIGKKIYEYEIKKKEAIINEDFSNAKICKFEIENLRTKIKNLDKPLPTIKPVKLNNSIDFSNSYDLIENYKNNSSRYD